MHKPGGRCFLPSRTTRLSGVYPLPGTVAPELSQLSQPVIAVARAEPTVWTMEHERVILIVMLSSDRAMQTGIELLFCITMGSLTRTARLVTLEQP